MKYHYVVTKDLATFGLSLSAGFGLVMIIIALAVSVVAGESAAYLVSGAIVVGLVLMVIGIAGWLVVVQPWRHFDDINQPLDDGHGHGHAADPHAAEQAIVPHDDSTHAVETAQH
ncbi:MAG: hypothetical protein U0452_08795 [Anaerolineae bacterium]